MILLLMRIVNFRTDARLVRKVMIHLLMLATLGHYSQSIILCRATVILASDMDASVTALFVTTSTTSTGMCWTSARRASEGFLDSSSEMVEMMLKSCLREGMMVVGCPDHMKRSRLPTLFTAAIQASISPSTAGISRELVLVTSVWQKVVVKLSSGMQSYCARIEELADLALDGDVGESPAKADHAHLDDLDR